MITKMDTIEKVFEGTAGTILFSNYKSIDNDWISFAAALSGAYLACKVIVPVLLSITDKITDVYLTRKYQKNTKLQNNDQQ